MRLFQNRVAGSSWTLPVTSVLAALVSGAAVMLAQGEWVCLPAIAAATYCMLEMNGANMLLRIRSRMVSCTFLAFTMMCGSSSSDITVALVQLAFVAALFLLCTTYQNKRMVGMLFYAMLLISLASLLWIQALWLSVLLLIVIIRPLYSLSFRGINAIFFGLIMPYCFYGLYYAYQGDYTWWETIYLPVIDTKPVLDYGLARIGDIISWTLLLIMSAYGTFHFLYYSYQDKIRVRMLYYMMIILAWLLLITIAVIPAYAQYLLPVLCAPASALTAHCFTHTSSRFTNISFIILLILVGLTTIFNQCLTSLSNTVLGVFS